MITETKFLDLREAAHFIGTSRRWMQRHYIDLIRSGVKVARIPKDSVKGRLLFNKESLSRYMEECCIKNRLLNEDGREVLSRKT